MSTEYRLGADQRVVSGPADLSRIDADVVWLDAVNPDDVELAELERIMGIEVPNKRDMAEIELSNRLYIDDGAVVMIGSLLPTSALRASAPRPATFILKRNLLLTMRYCEFASFDRVAASFFMNKLAFNLDATLGMINIEETKVIRVLSVVTLLFTPPVLIAGIYGMNFHNMPELGWPFGYLFSLALMLGSAGLSVWYLKRRKWL